MQQLNYAGLEPPRPPQKPRRHRRKKSSGRILLALLGMMALVALTLFALWKTTLPPPAQEALGPAATAPGAGSSMSGPVPQASAQPQPTQPAQKAESLLTADARAKLDAFLNAQPGVVSVWLQDIESGDIYTYNEGAGFYCASTLKAPYSLWLAQRAEAGEIDLNQTVGSGAHTGWQRIYTMIAQSSNGAARDLAEAWPGNEETGFSAFLQRLGFQSPEGCQMLAESIQGWVGAADLGRAMRALYDYFDTGTPNALELQKGFLNADHTALWCPTVAAKKYGSWQDAFHDTAIVYAQRPYVVSVFTDWGSEEVDFPPEAVAMMDELGHLIAEVMQAT